MNTIKDTYEGQWSSDYLRLQNLWDAGESVIVKWGTIRELRAENGSVDLNEGTRFGGQPIRSVDLCVLMAKKGYKFLDPSPRPEPSKLEWTHPCDAFMDASDGNFTYRVWDHGAVHITHNGKMLKNLQKGSKKLNFQDAKNCVHEWRVKFLEGMIGGIPADPLNSEKYRRLIADLEEIVGDYSSDTRSSLRSILDDLRGNKL